jgi:hypothetical protein
MKRSRKTAIFSHARNIPLNIAFLWELVCLEMSIHTCAYIRKAPYVWTGTPDVNWLWIHIQPQLLNVFLVAYFAETPFVYIYMHMLDGLDGQEM